jgi:hypothetical protein
MSLASHAYNAQSMANRGMLVNKNERDQVDAGLKQEELENQRRGQDMQAAIAVKDNATELAKAKMGQKPQEEENPSQTPPLGQQAPGAMSTFGSQVTYGTPKTIAQTFGSGSSGPMLSPASTNPMNSSVTSAFNDLSNPQQFAEGGPVEAPEPAQGYTLDPDVVQLLGEEFLDRITSFVQVTKHQLQQQQSGPPSEVM